MPFMPVKGFEGSEYLSVRTDYKTITDPFGGGEVILVPPIQADVCFLHGYCADPEGNVLMDKNSDSDLAAQGAAQVVVSVEERVESLDKVRTGGMKVLPGLHVDYMVQASFGAHPTSCPDRYPYDAGFLTGYLKAFKDGDFESWLAANYGQGRGA